MSTTLTHADAGLYNADELRWKDKAHRFAAEFLEPQRGVLEQDRSAKTMMPTLGSHELIGTLIPKAHGGQELTIATNTAIQVELAASAPSLAAFRGVCGIFVALPLLEFGNEEQKQTWLPRLATGEATSALGLTEPSAGSDAGSLKTRATKSTGGYVLNGFKHLISGAAEADMILVYAVTDPAAPAESRFSAFLVPTSLPGVTAQRNLETMGLRGFSHSELRLHDVELDAEEHLLGHEGQGLEIMMHGLVPERIDIAARAVGCASRAFHEALAHASQREQFGRPIRKFQAVSHKLADMRTRLTAAHLLVIHASRRFDAGVDAQREAAMAKLYAATEGFEICDDAMQILGGLGYTKASPVELMFRDIRVLRFGGGTDEIMRHIIQREDFAELHAALDKA